MFCFEICLKIIQSIEFSIDFFDKFLK